MIRRIQQFEIDDVRRHLVGCGYATGLLVDNFTFGQDRQVRLAAFAQLPIDARSACVAVVEGNGAPAQTVTDCQHMGAPFVLVHRPNGLECWKQTLEAPEKLGEYQPGNLARVFRDYNLAPDAVFRAKTRGRFDRQYWLPFVDSGLMPVVESQIGAHLSDLVEHAVHQLRESLSLNDSKITAQVGQWLVQSAFWLLAGKILHDKRVSSFSRIDLSNAEAVFALVAEHYGASVRLRAKSKAEREALSLVGQQIASQGHLGHVTTESLAYVYENALIEKEVRTKLGTHSTPSYLVDYMVWQLAPWIEEVPVADRHVFEPACGHAAFLVSAMRLLREILPEKMQSTRREYLRQHLHGIEIDPFALEIARLSLTLADIPNPNGWDLEGGDMFRGDGLEQLTKKAAILLTNPPFEDFTKEEKAGYHRRGVSLKSINKTTETLIRTLPKLREKSVIGLVIPQVLLHSKHAVDLRRMLTTHFELNEICLFPDDIFVFSDVESAIILGRRLPAIHALQGSVKYARVREKDRDKFKMSYAVTAEQSVPQARFTSAADFNMRVPDLEIVWSWCRGVGWLLRDVADVGQGMMYKGADKLPAGSEPISSRRFKQAVRGFAGLSHDLLIHEQPPEVWMSLESQLIRRPMSGSKIGIPQVLLNYAPVSRGPWRLKAFLDAKGHAATSRFLTARPKTASFPLEFLWALCNSPLANAYVYVHSMKRDIPAGLIRRMPIPRATEPEMRQVAQAARAYIQTVTPLSEIMLPPVDEDKARRLLLQMDAEVLRLYGLPPRLERQLLDLFAGEQRAGVPFRFEGYYSEEFEPCFPLFVYLSQEYQRSTAGELRARQEGDTPPELVRAMRRAVRDLGDE